ncbi:hypothetical protein E5222_16045 [Alteraurantiacibacter aquimixticola]|uniref:YdbS-like PH domain-containing protein n=1 Tax=Alteraurantiacibacter aquimixticola TaxID=2489173 RepID=A0A4T3EXQ6_9SPHN|nr:hypothetical protein E5222_16045 [Alteraurantiacibacter aquimixticola]
MAQGWQRVDPRAIAVKAVRGLQQALLPIAAAFFGAREIGHPVVVAIVVISAAIGISALAAWLAWRRLRYRVGESDIRVERGFISRQARSVPYERIQDVSLEQSLIPRLFNLVEVRFETGAGGKDELKLAYVTAEEGARLREVVRDQRAGEVSVASTADGHALPEPQPEGEVLFTMGPKRLLLFGLFEFSLVVFAVLGGAAQQFEFLLPFDIWNFEEWEQRLAGPGAWLAGLGWASRIVGAAIAVVLLGFVGLATGAIRTVLRDWDFRLEKTPKGFRRRRGLLTRTDVVMPVHRVQAITVGTGLLRRLWGWHGLSFISLAQDSKSANHVVAPFAQEHEFAPIIDAAGFALPESGTDWHRPSRKYRIDSALLAGIPMLLVAAAGLFEEKLWWLAPAGLFLAGAEALRQYLLWRFERHAIDPKQILSRRGWLAPRLTVASRIKLHSVEIAQGPLGKHRGYANLNFGLAGGSLSFDGLPLEEAEAMRAAVLDSIAAVDFARLPR